MCSIPQLKREVDANKPIDTRPVVRSSGEYAVPFAARRHRYPLLLRLVSQNLWRSALVGSS